MSARIRNWGALPAPPRRAKPVELPPHRCLPCARSAWRPAGPRGALPARILLLLSTLSLVLVACGAGGPDADIRDLRPTQINPGDVITVEASRPLFAVGAPTVVMLEHVRDDDRPVQLAARASTPTRVLFDADDAMVAEVGDARARYANATVTVVQTVAGESRRFTSADSAPFALDLFPRSLQRAGASLAAAAAAHGSQVPSWVFFALVLLGVAVAFSLPVPVIGGLIVVWERKVSAYMQSRLGPNRVGPNGWLQWLADGVKLILKEDVIPRDADAVMFRVSPYVAFIGLFLVFMVLPFSSWIIAADLDIGLLFLLSVTSLVVVSIILGGWSSNSKWSLLGGMRSAAQIISYELPASVAVLGIAALTGSLSTQAIVRAQGGWPWEWYLFRSPFLFVAFFVYFISALAEGNRTPFDLPEAESELVSGFATEYSGFRYALYPLVEWVNVFVIAAVVAMLFCGGWQLPFVTPAQMDASGLLQALGFAVYIAKIVAFIFIIIWIRWTLPRFRVDQMMDLCWKYLIPIAFACFVGTLLWAWLLPQAVQVWTTPLWFFVCGVLPTVAFARRVRESRARFTYFTTNAMFRK